MSDRYESKEPSGLSGPPLAARAVRQRDHHRLQLRATDLKGTEIVLERCG